MPMLSSRAQVNGGSQSFNAVSVMRNLVRGTVTEAASCVRLKYACHGSQTLLRMQGRWMRMFTIPNQSSVPKAWTEFDDDSRMKVRLRMTARCCHGADTLNRTSSCPLLCIATFLHAQAWCTLTDALHWSTPRTALVMCQHRQLVTTGRLRQPR